MSWLKKKLEELAADVNVFDGGKTGASVRASRPAQTVSQPKTQPAQTFKVTNNSATRGASRLYDQLNPFDNGRSWQTRTPTYQASAREQFRDIFDANRQQDLVNRNKELLQQGITKEKRERAIFPSYGRKDNETYRQQQIAIGNKRPYENLGSQLVGNSARLLNTGGAALSEISEAARGYSAIATGNDDALRASNERLRLMQQRMYQPDSGYLGAGTWFDSPEEQQTIGAADLAKRAGLNTLGAAAETIPFAKVGRVAGTVANPTIQLAKGMTASPSKLLLAANAAERGTAGILPRIGFNAAIDSTTGAGESIARQFAQTGTIDPKALAVDTLASTALGQTQVAASQITTKLAPNVKAFVETELTPGKVKEATKDAATNIKANEQALVPKSIKNTPQYKQITRRIVKAQENMAKTTGKEKENFRQELIELVRIRNNLTKNQVGGGGLADNSADEFIKNPLTGETIPNPNYKSIDPLESLKQEASVFRSEAPNRYGIGQAELGSGLYTGTKEIAGRTADGKVVTDGLFEYKVNPKANILDSSSDVFRSIDAKASNDPSLKALDGRAWQQRKADIVAELVKQEGYDGVRRGTNQLVAMSDNVLIPVTKDAPRYQATAPKTVDKTYYHGTQATIEDISKLNQMNGRMQNLFGPGIYLTDDVEIATGYANTRGKNTSAGKVLEGNIGDAKLYDLEDTLDADVARVFEKEAKYLTDFPEEVPDFSKLKGVDAIRELKQYFPDIETYDDFFTQKLHPYMESRGYHGFSHIGGVQGGKKHNVAILFDNKKLTTTPVKTVYKTAPVYSAFDKSKTLEPGIKPGSVADRMMNDKAYIEKSSRLKQSQKTQKVTKTSNNLYHTTKADNLASIRKNGLTTGRPARNEGVSSPDKISFSANESGAKYYGADGDVMLRTKRSYKPDDLELDLLAGGDGTYTTGKNIPPEMLEVKVNGKWKPLVESSFKQDLQEAGLAPKTKQDPYIKEYADTLRRQDTSAKGGQMIPDGEGGYKRISEHTPFYREFYKQNGKKPTRADYYDEAMRQVETKTADPAFLEYYNDINLKRSGITEAKIIDNKPPKKPSEAEWESMLDQAGKESKPTKKNLLKIRSEYNEQIRDAVKQGDVETANALREEVKDFGGQIKTITKENLPKNADAVIDDNFQVKTPMTLKDKETKKTFVNATKEYLGQINSRKIERDSKIIELNKKFDMTNEEKLNAIVAIDDASVKPMNDKVAEYVKTYRSLTDEAYIDYTSNGVSMGFQHQYLPRIYKNPVSGEAIDGNTYRLLMAGSSRQKGRSAELLKTDDLIYKDPTELLNSYYSSLDNAVAGKQYLDTLEKDGVLVKASEPVRGLRPIIAEGMQSSDGLTYYAQKDVANQLNELFGGKEVTNAVENLLEKGKGINSFVQSFVLSGGVPNTPINAFGIMQMTKEAMALHPVKAGKAFYSGLNKNFAKRLFTEKKEILKLMAENDITPRLDIQKIQKTGTQRISDRQGVGGKINQAWDEFTNDATFGRMMPALEVMHFENVYKSALRKYDSKKAASIAAESVKNFYGRPSDYKQAVRAKMTDDALGTFFFAPRFRESMINFWVKNAKSLNPMNLGKREYRDNQKFILAAALVWAGMEYANKEMNGAWMHDNPDGKKDKLIIPADVTKKVGIDTKGKDIGIPFLSSISTVPRNVASGTFNLATGRFSEARKNAEAFLSMPINTVLDIGSNEDYFGNKIVDDDATPQQKFTQAGAYIAKSNMQPWIREGLNIAGQNLPENVKKSLGIKEKSRVETIANATESPFRFYDPKYYRYNDSWTPKGGKDEKFTIPEQRARADIKKQIDSIPDSLKLTNKQKEAYEAIRAVDFDDQGNLVEDNDPFYKAKRATTLQDDGVFQAMKQRAILESKLNNKPIDPLYNLDPSQRRLILWKQTLPAGTKDPSISEMYSQEWYQDYRADQDRYFTAKQTYNKKMGYSSNRQQTNPYPEPSKELQAKLDYYYSLPKGTGARSAMLRENPDILAHWDRTEAWTNGERAKVGLGELEKDEPWSTGKYGGKGKGRKFDYKLDMFGGESSTSLTKALKKLIKEAELNKKS